MMHVYFITVLEKVILILLFLMVSETFLLIKCYLKMARQTARGLASLQDLTHWPLGDFDEIYTSNFEPNFSN